MHADPSVFHIGLPDILLKFEFISSFILQDAERSCKEENYTSTEEVRETKKEPVESEHSEESDHDSNVTTAVDERP